MEASKVFDPDTDYEERFAQKHIRNVDIPSSNLIHVDLDQYIVTVNQICYNQSDKASRIQTVMHNRMNKNFEDTILHKYMVDDAVRRNATSNKNNAKQASFKPVEAQGSFPSEPSSQHFPQEEEEDEESYEGGEDSKELESYGINDTKINGHSDDSSKPKSMRPKKQ